MATSLEEECGVARRSNCGGGRRTRGAPLAADDPFALPQDERLPSAGDYLKRPSGQLPRRGADTPLCAFAVVNTLFTFVSHSRPAAAWVGALVAADFVVVAGWPKRRRIGLLRGPLGWWPVAFGLAWLILGLCLGLRNATWRDPYVRAHHLRHHTNVNPTSDPRIFADAGIISFAVGTQLDIESSAGYRRWPSTFCAAPVRGLNDPVGPIGFWAVGTNCCESRGGFTCAAALDPEAASGIRPAISASDLERYGQAVRMAAAANGEVAAEAPVLLIWERDPERAATMSWWWALIAFVVQMFIALLFWMASRFLLTRCDR